MTDESGLDDLAGGLRGALDAEAAALVVGASPIGDVMRDGAVRRTRRRLAVSCGVTALAVLPIAAVAGFAGGAGAKREAVTAATSSGAPSYPPPIIVPTPLPAPGQLNPDLPNDSLVVLASGTVDGKRWRLIRDRYVVAGPEPANVMGDPSSRPHLPYAANWDKPGTIECDFTGVLWGDGTPGARGGFGPGACNPTDTGSIAGIYGRFAQGGSGIADPRSPVPYMEGRIDGRDAAYVTVDVDGHSSGKQPVIEVPGERNDYYMVTLPYAPKGYKLLTITVYDAQGHPLGSQQVPVFGNTGSVPSRTPEK